MNKFYIEEQLSERIGETPEGFLICYDVPVARTGEQLYKANEVPVEPNHEGLIKIQRTEEEVLKPETIASFEGKPFTIDHPDEMVTPENWKDFAHGFITNVRKEIQDKVGLLVGDIVVTTKKAIELIKSGMRQISCGYDADYEQISPGLGIQKNIIGNHVALVMRGRAGSRCAIGDSDANCDNNNLDDKKQQVEEDEDAMKFKDKLKNKLKKAYRKLVKDEDFEKLSEEEKADKLAEVAKDAIEEEESLENETPATEQEDFNETPPENLEEELSGGNGGEVTVADLNNKIDRLIGIIEAFIKSAASLSEDEESVYEKPSEEEKEEKEEKNFSTDEDEEEIDEEEKEEKARMEAMDCDSVWHDVAYRADILAPGIRISKPTRNHKKTLDSIKRRALKKAFATDSDTVSLYVNEKAIDKLTSEALDIAFIAASEALKTKNNNYVRDSVVLNTKSAVNEIRSIQERNKQFWSKKN